MGAKGRNGCLRVGGASIEVGGGKCNGRGRRGGGGRGVR